MEKSSEITVRKDGMNWISSLLRKRMLDASSQFSLIHALKLS